MALQIRRGPTADRMAFTPVVGELIFDTSTNSLYIGNGSTVGGLPAGTLNMEDVQDIAGAMLVGGTHNNVTFAYNDTTGTVNAQINLTTYDGVIEAPAFKGSVFANDSTQLVDAVTGKLRGAVVASSVIVGNEANPDLELTAVSSTVAKIETRPSAVLQLNSAGVTIGTPTTDNFLRVFSIGVENTSTIAATTYYNGAGSNLVTYAKARGTSAAPLAVVDNDAIYRFRFSGHDGTAFRVNSQISSEVDGVVSANRVPGRLNFSTTDSLGVLRSALQLTNTQEVKPIGNLVLENASQTMSVNQNGQNSRILTFNRSRGTAAVPTVSVVNDHIYSLRFNGYDGTAERVSSQIRAEVATSPTAGVVAGRLRFLTANTAGVQTTALTIDETQEVTANADFRVNGRIFGNVSGDLTGSVFADNSTMIVDGTNGILRGQLIGSVFADDSTMIIDGTNGNIPGYISVATLKTLASSSATYADFQTAIAAL